jgi:hypothetical protein
MNPTLRRLAKEPVRTTVQMIHPEQRTTPEEQRTLEEQTTALPTVTQMMLRWKRALRSTKEERAETKGHWRELERPRTWVEQKRREGQRILEGPKREEQMMLEQSTILGESTIPEGRLVEQVPPPRRSLRSIRRR